MTWHWFIFIFIVVFGNFLMLGSVLIGFIQSPALLVSGNGFNNRGTARYLLGTIFAFFLQSITAVTLSALIISYVYFITQGKGNIVVWIIGTIGAIYPMWQTWRLSGYERVAEPESYIAKASVHPALPFSLITTTITTLFFIFVPSFLNTVFYWLIGLTGFAVIVGIVSLVLTIRKLKSETEK